MCMKSSNHSFALVVQDIYAVGTVHSHTKEVLRNSSIIGNDM